MSGNTLAYHLRPNKAVDRELFLSFLARMSSPLSIENYKYIGLGGAFLEDFRVIHSRIGIRDMVSLEMEEETHLRQCFNKPIDCIECRHETIEEYLDHYSFGEPSVIWLDYTQPGDLRAQIERFIRTLGEVEYNSVIRVTLNANPASLGNPNPEELKVKIGSFEGGVNEALTLKSWRLEKFKRKLGKMVPADLSDTLMTQKRFGYAMLSTLKMAIAKDAKDRLDRKYIECFSTYYADGQPMITVTILVVESSETELEQRVSEWEFSDSIDSPQILDMPALSTLERIIMESEETPQTKMNYSLPTAKLGQDPQVVFKKFYRFFPHFARVEV